MNYKWLKLARYKIFVEFILLFTILIGKFTTFYVSSINNFIRELAEEEAIRLGERVKQYRDTNNLESDKIGTILLTTLVLILLEDMIYMIFEQFNSNVNLITIIQLRRYFNFMN